MHNKTRLKHKIPIRNNGRNKYLQNPHHRTDSSLPPGVGWVESFIRIKSGQERERGGIYNSLICAQGYFLLHRELKLFKRQIHNNKIILKTFNIIF